MNIDPQVYRDTQSNGFSSRIVKYYEKSQAKTRPIASRVYKRPGEFPVVNLEKSEINLNLRQNAEAPKVKIAPPIRSNYQANSRSEILRTGSLSGMAATLNKSTQASTLVSRSENEPLEPSNTDYETPTRSVLDALKEISRKRIHCEVS